MAPAAVRTDAAAATKPAAGPAADRISGNFRPECTKPQPGGCHTRPARGGRMPHPPDRCGGAAVPRCGSAAVPRCGWAAAPRCGWAAARGRRTWTT